VIVRLAIVLDEEDIIAFARNFGLASPTLAWVHENVVRIAQFAVAERVARGKLGMQTDQLAAGGHIEVGRGSLR
jgi:hypothetical protein